MARMGQIRQPVLAHPRQQLDEYQRRYHASALHLPRLFLRPFSRRPRATVAMTMAPTPALRERPFQAPPCCCRRRRRRRSRRRILRSRTCLRLGALEGRTARIPVFPIAFPCRVQRDYLLRDRGDERHGHVQACEKADDVLRFLGLGG